MKQEDWAEEFDNEFDEQFFDEDLGKDDLFPNKEKIKDFISDLLEQRTREVIDGIPDYGLSNISIMELKQQLRQKWLKEKE